MLNASGISVSYNADKKALEGVSLEALENQWVMLLGPNGAGKSTLIKALSRALPYDGRVTIKGQDVKGIRPKALARVLGVLQQSNPVNYAFTVEEIVRLGRYAFRGGIFTKPAPGNEEKVEQALIWTGMDALRDRRITTLSGGERQRAFLAQVFAQDPDILLLDEPSGSLDLKYQQALFDLVFRWAQKPGRCVISAVHDLSLARRYGSHAILLLHGRVAAQGDIKTVMSHDNLDAVYGMDVHQWMIDMLAQWA